jgi:hypothetical protein
MTPALTAWVERDIVRPTLDGDGSEGTPVSRNLVRGSDDHGSRSARGRVQLQARRSRNAGSSCRLLESDLARCIFETDRQSGDARYVSRFRRDEAAATTVVLASGGYPGSAILPDSRSKGWTLRHRFRRRTSLPCRHRAGRYAGRVVTSGGRVLSVTGIGPDLAIRA